MHRALAPLFLLATMVGCETENAQDRIDVVLANGEPTVRMDLEPVTLAADVDNNVDITVTFDAPTTESTEINEVLFVQYRVLYGFGNEECVVGTTDCIYIAGEIFSTVAEGGSTDLSLRGAVEAQLDWAQAHYAGDELDVPARVELQGYFASADMLDAYQTALNGDTPDDAEEAERLLGKLELVTEVLDYTATFADYR